MRHTFLILRNRLKILKNHARAIRKHLLFHLAAFLVAFVMLFVCGACFFYFLFYKVNELYEFGPILMDRLVGMVMMSFFSLLIFSNLIITLSTTYISREIESFMSQPVRHANIFFVKLIESTIYSSWGFAILAMPFFLAFGLVRDTSLLFYFGVALIIGPFLLIPASIGALMTMILGAFLPARRTLKWLIALVALGIIGSIIIIRVTGARSKVFTGDIENFSQVLEFLHIGWTLWSPHSWITQAILDLSRGNWRGYFYWFAMISSTALMLLQVCAWLAPSLYYRGWVLARESGRSLSTGNLTIGQKIFNFIERRLRFLNPITRALTMKDLKTFWRDPAQWSQLIILFGILFIYIANLRSGYFQRYSRVMPTEIWTSVLSLFNMAATCFILSILTTRFVFPMLSLEGKQFWVIGLAPIPQTRIVWEKYFLCWLTSFLLTVTLMIFSNWMLEVALAMRWISCLTIFFISFGLTSLSVGLGAAMPNFKEDNPARIANGLGGTLNIVLSLSYIGLFMVFEIVPIYLRAMGYTRGTWIEHLVTPFCVAMLVLIQATTVIVPMRVGLGRWRRMEF